MTTSSSLMSTACALGVSINVLLPVESVPAYPSSSVWATCGWQRTAEATALAPFFEHSVPAPVFILLGS